MNVYEAVGEFDTATFSAADLEIASVACLLLADGKYFLRRDGVQVMPTFSSLMHADIWFTSEFENAYKICLSLVLTHRNAELSELFQNTSATNPRIAERAERLASLVLNAV